MTEDERNTLWEALQILAQASAKDHAKRGYLQNVYDKAAIALQDALDDPRSTPQ